MLSYHISVNYFSRKYSNIYNLPYILNFSVLTHPEINFVYTFHNLLPSSVLSKMKKSTKSQGKHGVKISDSPIYMATFYQVIINAFGCYLIYKLQTFLLQFIKNFFFFVSILELGFY